MKNKVIKGITIILCITMVLNFMIPNMTYAEQTDAQKEEARKTEGYDSFGGKLADGIVGIVTWPTRVIIVAFGASLRLVIGGIVKATGGEFNMSLGPEDILFNKIEITKLDFFNFDNGLSDGVLTIRRNIAIWYYALRNLAIGILLVILVYVGIRMAISTVAEEEAKYKKMLQDWLVSFVLVFLLQYIILFTLNANNALVEIMNKARENASPSSAFSTIVDTFQTQAVDVKSFTRGFGSSIAFCILVGTTLSFLIFYIKRMLTIAFLIIISPIVTITYSIDKMGDNQSQALNNWLKEFVYTILIQPFQCVIYLVFATTAVNLMNDKTLGASILGCIMLLFIHKAEDIVRSIFSFEHAHSLGSAYMKMEGFKAAGKGIAAVGGAVGGFIAGRASASSESESSSSDESSQPPKQTNQGREMSNNTNNSTANNGSGKDLKAAGKEDSVLAKAIRLRDSKIGKYLGLSAKAGATLAGTFIGAGARWCTWSTFWWSII